MQPLTKLALRLFPLTLIIFLLVGRGPVAAQNVSTQRILSVTGHGHSLAATTLAEITLGISNKNDSAKATYDSVTKRSSSLVKLLNTQKAAQVQTSNITLNPQFGRDGKSSKATYDGYQTIQFLLPVSKIAVLDQAMATEIETLQGIRYIASEQDMNVARNKALEIAIADAQAQAKVALDKLSLSSQEIMDIRLGDATVDTVEMQAGTADKYSSSDWSSRKSPSTSGDQRVNAHVTLQIRY